MSVSSIHSRRVFFASVALAACLVACSSEESAPQGPTSGLDRSHALAGLSIDDQKKLCDWEASRYGGYGQQRAITCNGTSVAITADADQAKCLADAKKFNPACEATVGDFEICINEALDNPCVQTAAKLSSCNAFAQCLKPIGDAGGD